MVVRDTELRSHLSNNTIEIVFTIASPAFHILFMFHTGLCKFLRNISTNIQSLGKRTDLKLGEVSSLFISYEFTISWLYPPNSFQFPFFIAWQRKRSISTCSLNDVNHFNVTVNSSTLYFPPGWFTPIVGLLVSLLLFVWACLLSLSSRDKNVVYNIFANE